MSNASLEERLQLIEDTEAIRNLKHRYMDLCDRGYQPEPLTALFTEDGIWDGGEAFGSYEGKAAIKAFFNGISSSITFAAHLALNELIQVDGDTATGRWRALVPGVMEGDEGKTARWALGDYEDEYVRVNNEWKFKRVNFFINFNVSHDESWVETAISRP